MIYGLWFMVYGLFWESLLLGVRARIIPVFETAIFRCVFQFESCFIFSPIFRYNVLKAYSVYDREVGYVQGMGFVTGLLLLYA